MFNFHRCADADAKNEVGGHDFFSHRLNRDETRIESANSISTAKDAKHAKVKFCFGIVREFRVVRGSTGARRKEHQRCDIFVEQQFAK